MEIEFWYWLVFAVALFALEVFAPGASLLWFGLAAAITGAVLWLAPTLGWEYQLLIFAVLSVVSSALAWRYIRKRPVESAKPNLNEPGREFLGRTFVVHDAIENGIGQVKVGDGLWRAACEVDVPKGAKVRVKAVDGATLRVEPLEA